MADGLCTGDTESNVIEKTAGKDSVNAVECMKIDCLNDVACENVKSFFITSDSDKLCDKLCVVKGSNGRHEGFLDMEMPCSFEGEEDCRKKRCADRYDSSESSDSGVAVLSCTDCSGSSTASSDITDPGSPFSTASSHSEDSASQPAKMPPTQSAHHPPWPWATGESPPVKRHTPEKTVFPKRLKTDGENADKTRVEDGNPRKPPAFLSSTLNHLNTLQTGKQPILLNNKSVPSEVLALATNSNCNKAPSSNLLQNDKLLVKSRRVINNKKPEMVIASSNNKSQVKITEYFKSQMNANGIKKELSNSSSSSINNSTMKLSLDTVKHPNLHKYFSLVGGLKQNISVKTQNNLRKIDVRTVNPNVKRVTADAKQRKLSPITVPRKILPAPSKVCDKVTVNSINNVNSVNNFTPTVTLTTLAIPPNLTYLHTKTPKPPDNFFLQQFTTLTSDKLSTIPIVNTPCMIHPLQKITTINNFNCIKLNATVVPIVKLNTLPSKVNGPNFGSVALNVDAGVPTVLPAKTKPNECSGAVQPTPFIAVSSFAPPVNVEREAPLQTSKRRVEEQQKPSPPSSDSGLSSAKELLEVAVNHAPSAIEPQKSPILSQPKTIRFPAKQRESAECNKESSSRAHSADATTCRWAECHAQFDTSGALLEHLQIKHVISQATQEQYVCLWIGCKVHGRTSCSRTWLERHVLAHAGTKPFRCIVEGCGMRFNSQLALERHVNGHFNTDGSQNTNIKKSVDNNSVKLFKRNGKRIRFRRQPWSARLFDFFDNGIMEGLQYRLLKMTETRTSGKGDSIPGDTVLLHSQLLASRVENDGQKKMLVRWHPANILPDEWVRESEYISSKVVSIKTLQSPEKNALKQSLFPPHDSTQSNRHKQHRKPSKCT